MEKTKQTKEKLIFLYTSNLFSQLPLRSNFLASEEQFVCFGRENCDSLASISKVHFF